MTDSEVWLKSHGTPLMVGMKVRVNESSKYFQDHENDEYFLNAIRLKTDGKTLDLTTGSFIGQLEFDGWTIAELSPVVSPAQALNGQSQHADHSQSERKKIEDVLDECLSDYRFGEGVNVVASNPWQQPDMKDGCHDYTKIVYLTFDESPGEDSQKCSFHVMLNPDTNDVVEVYGLLMSNGAEIGFYDEMAAAGFCADKWHVISSYDQSLLGGPYDSEEEAEEDISENPELAGGTTYLHESTPRSLVKPR